MKIALLHYSAPPIVGGVESVLGHHARLMVGHGQQVCIIAGRGQQMDERVEFVNVPIVDSRHPEVLTIKAELDAGRVPRGFDNLSERIAVQLLEAIGDADHLIAHNVCSLNKNLALTAAIHRLSESKKGPRLILWHHDLAWTTPRYRPELHDGYPWDLLRTDWPWAQQVVVSESRRRELMELMGLAVERIRVVPNGVDLAEFLKLAVRTQKFITQLELASAAPLILLPVRITPRKNIELALQVVAALRRQFPDVKLIVTGPLGPHNPANAQYFERLLAMRTDLKIESAAYFLAELSDQSLPDDVIADFYKMADLLLLPSREEGFGIPVLEAGLAGIPVFCTDITPLRDLGGIDADYFSLDDNPDEIAAKISAVLRSSPIYALRKRVLQNYVWEQVYTKHIVPLLAKG